MAITITFCCAKFLTFITINVSYLAIGIVLWLGTTSQYGMLIEYETQHWSQGAIVDVISTTASSCPNGYEQVTGKFYGTKTICDYGLYYTIGACGRKSLGVSRSGLSASTMSWFNDLGVCVKRDSSLSYHNLVQKRNSNCPSTSSSCGSASDKEKQFCLSSTSTCPLNALEIKNSSLNATTTSTATKKAFGTSWNGYLTRDNSSNSPMSEIYIAISRPCGIRNQDYMERGTSINSIYEDTTQNCHYDNGGKEHQQFFTAGFDQQEYDTYNNNSLISAIKDKVPRFSESELRQNSYRVYYRPFASWKQSCQLEYTTQDAANEGSNIGDVSEMFLVVFIITIVLYGLQFLYLIFSCWCSVKCRDLCQGILNIKCTVLETLSFIALLIVYAITINGLRSIDLNMIKYFSDNQCSDGPLQFAIDTYSSEFEHDMAVTGLGLAFVLLTLIIKVLLCVCCSPLRELCQKACCIKCDWLLKQTMVEQRIELAKDNIKEKYGSYFKNAFAKKTNIQPAQGPTEAADFENGGKLSNTAGINGVDNIFGPSMEQVPLNTLENTLNAKKVEVVEEDSISQMQIKPISAYGVVQTRETPEERPQNNNDSELPSINTGKPEHNFYE